MNIKKYKDVKSPTPEVFKGKHNGKTALVIGTGPSTRNLIKYKNVLKNKFDVIIGLNLSTLNFEEEMDYHLVLEKNPVKTYEDMISKEYRKDLPRILNWKSLHHFPQDANIIKATRAYFGGDPNIREYRYNGEEGFMNGPTNKQGFSIGSVGMHGIHLAGILGCSKVYLIGINLIFDDKYDHYYKDRYYRDNASEKHKSTLIKIERDGKIYDTSQFFKDSAEFIDFAIDKYCKPAGLGVYDFSGGILLKPEKLDLDKFFSGV